MQPGAGSFPAAIAEPADVTGFKFEQVNLVEGIRFLALTLENHSFPIMAEVALPGAFAGESQLTGLADK